MDSGSNVATSPTATGAKKRSWLKTAGLIVLALVLLVVAAGAYLWVFERPHHTAGTPKAIVVSGDKVLDSIRRGVEFLKAHQEANGEFSLGLLDPKPGFTALVV